MTPITGKCIGIGIIIFGFILFYSGLVDEGTRLTISWVGGVGIIAIIGGFIFYAVYWMCPSCGRFLPTRTWFVEYCHRCGESIDKPRFK